MNAKKLAPLDNKIAEMDRRGLLEGLGGAEILLNNHARLAERRRGRGRYVFVFGRQDPRAGFKELDACSKCIED